MTNEEAKTKALEMFGPRANVLFVGRPEPEEKPYTLYSGRGSTWWVGNSWEEVFGLAESVTVPRVREGGKK